MFKVILAVPERYHLIYQTMKVFPDAKVVSHPMLNPADAFIKALKVAGMCPLLFFEDDIQLSSRFAELALPFIAANPDRFIAFFSQDVYYTRGTRENKGKNFEMSQCIYLPAGMAAGVVARYDKWKATTKRRQAHDYMIAEYMEEHGINYIIHEPNLVQHLPIPSAIDPGRPVNRQSRTFLP